MNSEHEKELIDYLNSVGFEGSDLVEDLKQNIKLGAPRFSLLHEKAYGQERMFFELYFKRDHQFNAYRLDGYKATHRREIKIDHKVINGLSTAELEHRMQQEDWKDYFGEQQGYDQQLDRLFIQDTLAMLFKLSEKQDFNGIKIQEELIFKYWPAENVDHASKQDLSYAYELSREFKPSELGICSAHLAYHILSGRLEHLHEMLSGMRLEEYPGIDLYPLLEKQLSKNPTDFIINGSHNTREAYAEFTIPISFTDGAYEPGHYQLMVTPYPGIDHGHYNGIESLELERMMAKIDWRNDHELFVFHEGAEPEFRPRVGDVQEQMYRLSQDLVGAGIAEQLQLKYWADATFFSDNLDQGAWDLLESLPKKTEEFPCDVEAFVAYNLLCGRAVQEQFLFGVPEEKSQWVRLNYDEKAGSSFVHVEGYANEDLENTLSLIPLQNQNYYQILNSLKRGGTPGAVLKTGKDLLLEANPEGKTINVFTREGRPVPVNIHYDPDWKPPLDRQATALKIQAKETTNTQKAKLPSTKQKQRGKGL